MADGATFAHRDLRYVQRKLDYVGTRYISRGGAAVLRRKCSEQVSYSVAVNPEEVKELTEELPEKIRKNLQESLDREIVVLRYDAVTRCAYYVAREGQNLVVWLWCEMGLHAAGQLLSAVIEINESMSEERALALYELAMSEVD
jgi:hypothetical protein